MNLARKRDFLAATDARVFSVFSPKEGESIEQFVAVRGSREEEEEERRRGLKRMERDAV